MPKWLPEQKAKARQMYFEHYTVSQIAAATKLNESQIQFWVHGKATTDVDKTWKWQRNEREKQLTDTLVCDNIFHIQKLYRVSLPLIVDSITIRAKKAADKGPKNDFPNALTIKEAKELTEIITHLDKLLRLDTNRPTEIYGLAPVTIDQLKKAVEMDVFVDVTVKVDTQTTINQIEKDEVFDEQLRGVLSGVRQSQGQQALPPGRDVEPLRQGDAEPDREPEDWAGFSKPTRRAEAERDRGGFHSEASEDGEGFEDDQE